MWTPDQISFRVAQKTGEAALSTEQQLGLPHFLPPFLGVFSQG